MNKENFMHPRRPVVNLLLLSLLLLTLGLTPRPAAANAAFLDPALVTRLATAPAGTPLSVVVTYAAPPTATDLARFDALGVTYAPLSRLPMAGALATPAQIAQIAQWPGVVSVYL